MPGKNRQWEDEEGIWRTLSVCSSHITENDSRILSDSYSAGQVMEHENGWILWVPYDEYGFPNFNAIQTYVGRFLEAGLSHGFCHVFRLAVNLECMLINISGTGKEWSGLAKHDW